ncbi:hypothetical protein [Mangrovimonas sp. YM274]|uniref:DUF6843 domain-containing protein n=1 Tax=Mangrovimonas sp. YM274 TaxID=3070660 RepID=UPI0027DDE4BC|nr:hypothetical protein [Mangrovimonas sp. YM274]WMI70055.1 hypothetical protein RBH95_06825 [Mangrovimonas sp. YM274]
MNQKTNDILFYFGIALLLIGAFGLTFAAFFAIIGLPIFIVGIILILLSKRKLKIKTIWILGSIVGIVAFWPIWTKINTIEPETYLVPENFNGKIKIIYGLKCGIKPKVENGRRILEIPNDGILFVDYEFKSGIIDHEYYSIDKNGERVKLERYENYKKGTKNVPGIGFGASGNFPGEMPNGGISSESPLTVHYSEFQVIRDSTVQYDFKKERKFDSIVRARIEKCK